MALALTAMLAGLLLPFAGQLIRTWSRGEGHVQDADGWMRLISRLQADLATAIPLPIAAGGPELVFRMDRNAVILVRPPRREESGGLQITAYVIEQSKSGDALVNYSATFDRSLALADPRSLGNATAVFTGPYRLGFATVDADGIRAESWRDRAELPRAIELSARSTGVGTAATVPIILPIVAYKTDPPSPRPGTK
uniref:Prepilin-type cleavage/methylation-like protein n=1 Tax=Rhodopseudomonas palustris (strain BisA53) TaxID=316055 RepID=Q07N89_RHOP5